jgi:hypothetical protein
VQRSDLFHDEFKLGAGRVRSLYRGGLADRKKAGLRLACGLYARGWLCSR